MKVFKNISVFLLLALLTFSACRKDEIIDGKDRVLMEPVVIVKGSISGIVVDVNDQPLEGVMIALGTNSIFTDENGYFLFKEVDINERGSMISAEKDGYFYNSKFVGSKLNKLNFTRIKMIEKNLSGTFQSEQGGTVTIANGGSIDFPVNGIKLDAGGDYNGNVNVYATWLDPTTTDLAQRMPGDLRAMNAQEEQVQLTTYGMIGVELEGDAGEALNLADGQMARIEVPVPSALLGSAPTTIPLWYFNESSGYWEEEGEATLQGDKYIGTVSHFSFWNYDEPNLFVFIDGLITSESGFLDGLLVEIAQTSTGISGVAYTNEDGLYAGYVPKDEALIITVYNNCGEVIYTAEIGPFMEDTTIPTISVDANTSVLTLTGTVLDCDNNPVTNGYLLVYSGTGYNVLYLNDDGTFNSTISVCDAMSISTKAYDLENLKQSSLEVHDISNTNNLDLGTIVVCEVFDEYLNFSINGVPGSVLDPIGILEDPNTTVIIGSGIDMPTVIFELKIIVDQPGNFTPILLLMTTSDPDLVYLAQCSDIECNDTNVNITTFENIGGYIIGSISGQVFTGQGVAVNVEADFKVLRE